MAYRFYVTDGLKIIAENTAHLVNGTVFNISYRDIINPKPVDTRTSEDIIDDIRSKLKAME